MRINIFLVALLFLISSCGDKSVKVSGNFSSLPDDQSIYLELVSNKGQNIIDSAKIQKGNFKFRVKLTDNEPAIYNIRHENQIIPLLISPGDKIKISSIGNIGQNYLINGSSGSSLMREITSIMNNGAASLDSLSNLYANTSGVNDSLRRQIASQYATTYYQIKREQISFIVTNPSSLAALYALYQRLPNDNSLFNGKNDVIYYKLVADSLGTTHPSSPYLKALQKELDLDAANINLSQMIEQASKKSEELGFPDIEIADMYGKKIKLSSLKGKVILIDFWTATDRDSRMTNAELKQTYSQFADMGFEIYQVSLDESKPLWVTTVQDQKLPWISVNDFRGTTSSAARMYNISTLPTNFLIDRDGNIVAKNLHGTALNAKIKGLL